MPINDPAGARLQGFLVIDKPAAWTSHDVVARVRRLVGERRVGHAGTLDPAATGVLPLAVGAATKVVEYLADASKTYRAEVTFGVRTDSADADGVVMSIVDASGLTVSDVERELSPFRGTIAQVPPMHSAIKLGGRRLYELARRGETVDRPLRTVTIHVLELLAWDAPVATLLIDCSKGTYVRSLAQDLGEVLGVGAHLSDLVRLRTGPFTLCHAVTLAQLAEAPLPWVWPELAFHPDTVLADWPALLLDQVASARWTNGQGLAGAVPSDDRCRAYAEDGRWLGVGQADAAAGHWRPTKVIVSAA